MIHPFLTVRNFLPFAHRGANYYKTENTSEAFKKAMNLGFIHIETDVRASKDGVPYIFHDSTLERLTGDRIAINKLTSTDLAKIRLRGGNAIPKLEETLEEFPQIFFNIDVKSWDVVKPLAKTINHLKTFNQICIGSFNDYRIYAMQKLLNAPICFSAGTIKSFKILVMINLGMIPRIVEPCIQLPLFYKGRKIINQFVVSKIKKSRTKLHIWGTNNETHITELIDFGIDGLMVDDCVLLKKILTKKGIW
ncbi:MAG: glycerophosphodiester phosphodiesterase family protein [Pseudomonadota bacterium]|nr:glycerophosphodiester phosphodiesterase family protein [Pseudomonadota bacterium]